jgi:hypothetical protein
VFTTLWHRIEALQPTPPYWLIAGTAALALVLVVQRRLWRLTRNVVTIAHEGGHALVSILCGRRLQSITLHSDTSGLTVSKGKPHGFGMVMTLMVGYNAPSLIGLGGAWLLSSDRIRLTLWISIVLLLAMLLMIRNGYGMLAVVLTGGLVFLVSWYTSPQVQAGFAYAGVWFLLLGGVRPIFELVGQRRRGQAQDSDVDQLHGLTRVPAFLWLGLFMIVSLGALGLGASLLRILGEAAHLR